MLTCTIGWRTLIPVRAIPYLTGGTFDARDVATLFFHPDKFAGVGFSPRTRAFRAGANSSLVAVASGEWGLAYHYFRRKGDHTLIELKHIRRLPAGVFVWRRSFKILYDFLAKQDSAKDAEGLGDHPAGTFGWMEDLRLTPAQHAIVWEGCSCFSPNHDGTATGREEVRAALADTGVSAGAEASAIPTRALVERKLTTDQLNRRICMQHAKRYWHRDPSMTQKAILRMPEVERFVDMYKDPKTVRGWIREVDPRPVETRRGRPKRR